MLVRKGDYLKKIKGGRLYEVIMADSDLFCVCHHHKHKDESDGITFWKTCMSRPYLYFNDEDTTSLEELGFRKVE